MAASAPRVGIVADALYLYRIAIRRQLALAAQLAGGDSYTTVLERGYLALLRRAAEDRGSVPAWVQNLVLYDLLFYFRWELRTSSPTGLAPVAWTDRFHALAEEVLRYIDVETIDGFAVIPTSRQLKESLVIGYKGQRTVPASIALSKLDADQRLVQLRYFFGGSAPDEEISVGGRAARPAYAKTRDITYFNRVLLYERIMWLPAAADMAVSIGGRRMPLAFEAPRKASAPREPGRPSETDSRVPCGAFGGSSSPCWVARPVRPRVPRVDTGRVPSPTSIRGWTLGSSEPPMDGRPGNGMRMHGRSWIATPRLTTTPSTSTATFASAILR